MSCNRDILKNFSQRHRGTALLYIGSSPCPLCRRVSIIIIIFSFLFVSCNEPFAVYEEEYLMSMPSDLEMGLFVLRVDDVSRTIVPTTPVIRLLTLSFTPTGGNTNPAFSLDSVVSGGLVSLHVLGGTYDLHITAFSDIDKNFPVAHGTLAVNINAGATNTFNIDLFAFTPGGGSGGGWFEWEVTVPEGVIFAEMRISPIDSTVGVVRTGVMYDSATPLAASTSFTTAGTLASPLALPSGYYEILFTLKKEDPNVAGATRDVYWQEVLHIYQNLTSEETFIFTDAHFNTSSYIVTFDENHILGANPRLQQSVLHGMAVPLYEPAKTGYKFEGWSTTSGDTVDFLDTTLVINDITVYAVWQPITYHVRYMPNGGTGVMADSNHQYEINSNLTPNSFTRTNFIFKEWNIFEDGFIIKPGVTEDDPDIIINGDAYEDQAVMYDWSSTEGDILILYAQWTQNIFTVTFNGAGGTPSVDEIAGVSTNLIDLGVTTLPTAARAGYTFVRWYYIDETVDSDNITIFVNENFTASVPITEDLTVYAEWNPISYTVSYNANGGTGTTAATTHTFDMPQDLRANGFTRDGFTFMGWSTTAGGVKEFDNGQTVMNLMNSSGNLTLYAVWSNNAYTVAYHGNGNTGGVAPSSTANLFNTPFHLASHGSLTRDGFTFAGWNTLANGTGTTYAAGELVNNLTATVNGTVNLYAVWAASNYTVTFNANGGEPSIQTVANISFGGSVGSMMPAVTRTGYTLTGWSTTPTGTVNFNESEPVINNLIVYAVWTPINYTVVYNGNGGSDGADIAFTSTHQFDSPSNLMANTFSRTNFTFAGWNTAANGSGENFTDGQSVFNLRNTSGSFNLYAKWDVNIGNVTLERIPASGGTADMDSVSGLILISANANTGYTFREWTTSSAITINNPNSQNTFFTMSGSAVTVTANYNRDISVASVTTVSVSSHTYNGNQQTPTFTITHDGVNVPATNFSVSYAQPTRINAGVYNYTIFATGTGYVGTINGTFTVDPKQINDASINVVSIEELVYNAAAQTPDIEIRDTARANAALVQGTAAGAAGVVDFYITPATGTAVGNYPITITGTGNYTGTLTGQSFDIVGNPVTVTFDANAGADTVTGMPSATNATFKSPYGAVINTTPSRTGYDFDGWFLTSTGGTALTAASIVEDWQAHTLYAQWTINSYTLSYDGNTSTGGTAPAAVTQNYGTTATVATNTFSKTDYKFKSWNTAANGSGTTYLPGASFTFPAANTVLYAQWELDVVTVSFIVDGVAYATVPNVTIGSTLGADMPTNPANKTTGYAVLFDGWSTTNGGTVNFTGSTIVSSAMTVYAVFKPYEIGDTGPGGGTIYHRTETGFIVQAGTGFSQYTAHYLEAAPANSGSLPIWGDRGTAVAGITTATSDAAILDIIGNGRRDTQLIVAHMNSKGLTGTAAQLAVTSQGGQTDWFLPSFGELYLYYQSGVTGVPTTGRYWSSTQYDTDWSWMINFGYDYWEHYSKAVGTNVRAVRAF